MSVKKAIGEYLGNVFLEQIIDIKDEIADGYSIYVLSNESKYYAFGISHDMDLSEDGFDYCDYVVLCDRHAYDVGGGTAIENTLFDLMLEKPNLDSVSILTKLFSTPGAYSDDVVFSSFGVPNGGADVTVYSIDHDRKVLVKE